MRKFVSLLLVFAALFTFAACENTPQTSSAGESSEVSERSSEADISKIEQELSEVQSEINSVIEEMSKGSSSETTSAETSSDSSETSSEGSSSEDSAYSESSQEISPILTGKPSLGVPNDEQFEALLNAVAYVRECYDNKKIAFRLNSRIFPDSLIGYEESEEWVIKIDNTKQRVYVRSGGNNEYKAEGAQIYCRRNGEHSWKIDTLDEFVNSFEEAKEEMPHFETGASLPLLDTSDWEKSDFFVVSETEEAIAFVTNRFLLKEVNADMPLLYMNRESKQQISTTMLILHKNNGRLYQLRTQFELSDESENGAKGRLRFQEGNWFFGYEDDLNYRVSNYPNGYPIIEWNWD